MQRVSEHLLANLFVAAKTYICRLIAKKKMAKASVTRSFLFKELKEFIDREDHTVTMIQPASTPAAAAADTTLMCCDQGCNSFSHCTNYLVGGILNPALWLGITIGNMHMTRLFFELDSRRFALITSYVTLFGLFCEATHCILTERLYFSSTFTLIPDNAVDFDLIHIDNTFVNSLSRIA